ncbi:MAG: hypothetical protein ACJZ70_03495 [Limisphaerales bacterium]
MDQTKEINEVLKLLPLILVLMLIIQGYWLVTTSLFPKFINNARSQYKKPIRTTLVGLAVIVPTFFLGFKFLANISNPISTSNRVFNWHFTYNRRHCRFCRTMPTNWVWITFTN